MSHHDAPQECSKAINTAQISTHTHSVFFPWGFAVSRLQRGCVNGFSSGKRPEVTGTGHRKRQRGPFNPLLDDFDGFVAFMDSNSWIVMF